MQQISHFEDEKIKQKIPIAMQTPTVINCNTNHLHVGKKKVYFIGITDVFAPRVKSFTDL